MINKSLVSFIFAALSLSSLAVADESPKKIRTQTSYFVAKIPSGVVSLPTEGVYRIKRSLHKDKWSKMMKDEEVQTLLAQTKDKRTPKASTVFPFENFKVDFEGVFVREFGVCSGFATLQRNFNILMQFDPENKHAAKIPSILEREKYLSFYTKLINKAYNYKPVIIPGFKNINEFLSVPELKIYAKKTVGRMWARNNASFQGMQQLHNISRILPESSWKNLHTQLKKRLDFGYNPLVYASFRPTPDIKKNIHVIQVMGVSEYDLDKDTYFNVYIWDDGVLKDFFGDFRADKLVKVVSFRKNGTALWLEDEKYLKLDLDNSADKEVAALRKDVLIDDTLWIDLLPNDDHTMSKVVRKKLRWCKSKEELKVYCGL